MRTLLSRIFTNSLSIFLVSLVFSGLSVSGGFINYVIAGALLSVLSIVLDPIIKAITLPFHILTLGLISFLTTLVALFIVTIFFKSVEVHAFIFPGFSSVGLTIGTSQFSNLL